MKIPVKFTHLPVISKYQLKFSGNNIINLPAAPPSSLVTVERAPARPPDNPLLPPPNLENRLAIPPVKFVEI